ncbi:50S ribosomal protein L28 [bacterium]|nr:50S ribosomal protein L28 [bacterium]
MARRCSISGKQGQFGNRVSHAKNRTKHLFKPNLQSRRIFVPESGHPEGGQFVRVKVSTRVLRTMDKLGVRATLQKYGLTLKDIRS